MPQLQLFGDCLITREIGLVEIIQQTASLRDHFQQATAGAVVLDALLKVLSQVVDPLRQQGDLHIR